MIPSKKRKLEANASDGNTKRLKMMSAPEQSSSPNNSESVSLNPPQTSTIECDQPVSHEKENASGDNNHGKQKEIPVSENKRQRIKKLVPPRPFPTVPTSVSATGPRSSHREGKNMICLTRRTPLGTYMRRCKDLILKDGYKTLHLSAMGAAIPHLLQLVAALPPILPFHKDEIKSETTTGTIEVQDEVTPEDEDEDISYQSRSKSTLRVVFKIGDGQFEGDSAALHRYSGGKTVGKTSKGSKNNGPKLNATKKGKEVASAIVYEEPEQEYMDML